MDRLKISENGAMNFRQRLYREAEAKRRRCSQWLSNFMRPGQPKPMTKDEFFELAQKDLNVSRTAFNDAWIWAIEANGRLDWYEPMRGQKNKLRT